MGGSVTQLFEAVRRAYFPRWDRQGRWTVRVGTPPGRPRLRGYCDPDTRTIWVAAHPDEHTMIHEIVHAVAGPGHALRFQERLSKAADVAETQGNAELAGGIHKEVADYAGQPNLSAEDIYGQIRDAAWECDNFDAMVRWISEDMGSTPEEFAHRYRRARRVFDKAKQEAIDERARMATIRAALAGD
jgi:hypothetical protein